MTENLYLKNNIPSKNLKKGSLKLLSKEFEKIFSNIKNDIADKKKKH